MLSKPVFTAVKPDMEIITADGKRAGYVIDVVWGEIVARAPARRIPLSWLRHVDKDDIYIAAHLGELDQAQALRRG